MKTCFCSGLLVFSLLLGAGVSLRAADAPAKAEATPTTQEGIVTALLSSIEELTGVLEGIKDEASVPGAKDKLATIMRRQVELSAAMKKLGEPKPEDEAKLKEKYEAKMNAATEKLGVQFQRLSALEAFKKAMKEIRESVEKEQAPN